MYNVRPAEIPFPRRNYFQMIRVTFRNRGTRDTVGKGGGVGGGEEETGEKKNKTKNLPAVDDFADGTRAGTVWKRAKKFAVAGVEKHIKIPTTT